MSNEEFDKLAKDYKSVHKKTLKNFSSYDCSYFIKYKIDIIRKELKNEPENILDFGCGIGESSEYISQLFPTSNITAIDNSELSIEEVKKRNIPNCTCIASDILKNGIQKKYDLIFASCVFHHIEPSDRKNTIEVLYNSLNKNGRIYIFEHNPYNPFINFVVKTSVIDKGITMINPFKLQKLIKSLKYDDMNIKPAKFTLFIPRFNFLKILFPVEKYLDRIPLGGQFYQIIEKNK